MAINRPHYVNYLLQAKAGIYRQLKYSGTYFWAQINRQVVNHKVHA